MRLFALRAERVLKMVIDAPRAERLLIVVALCAERLQNQNTAFKHSELKAFATISSEL